VSKEWPEMQLELPDLGSDAPAPDHRNSDQSITRGGRVKESKKGTEIVRGQGICPKCGWTKTIGLPCPTCAQWGPK